MRGRLAWVGIEIVIAHLRWAVVPGGSDGNGAILSSSSSNGSGGSSVAGEISGGVRGMWRTFFLLYFAGLASYCTFIVTWEIEEKKERDEVC